MTWISRIETKVWAAMAGTGAGAVVSGVLLWGLGVVVWSAAFDAAHAEAAIAAVPKPVAAFVALLVTVLGTLIGGWTAPPSNHAGNPATPKEG